MEGHCKQIPLACVGSAHSEWTTLSLSQSKAAYNFQGPNCSGSSVLCKGTVPIRPCDFALMMSKSLRFSCTPQGHRTQVGCVFCSLPRSKPLRWLGAWRVHSPRWAMHLMQLPAWFYGCAMREQFQVCHASPFGSWSQAVTFLADVNHPGYQEYIISNQQSAHNLVGDVVSVAKIVAASCLMALALTHLPLYLWGWRAQNGSQLALLWFLLGHKSLFCECARVHHVTLESFMETLRPDDAAHTSLPSPRHECLSQFSGGLWD